MTSGNDFFEANRPIKYLFVQAAHHLLVGRHRHLVDDPLNEDTKQKRCAEIIQGLSLSPGADMKLEANVAVYGQLARIENSKLSTVMKRNGFANLSVEGDPTGLYFIELYASKQNADGQFYCNRKDT